MLLDRAATPYSQSCAATTLTKMISKPCTALPVDKRLDIKLRLKNIFSKIKELQNSKLEY